MNFHLCKRAPVPGLKIGMCILLLVSISGGQTGNPESLAGQPARSVPQSNKHDRNDPGRNSLLAADIQQKDPPILPPNVIVDKLMATGARRSSQLHGFRAMRSYRLQYHGLFGTKEATMQVLATYAAPDHRDFSIIAQSGSKLLINRVLLKLLDSEREALQHQSQVELNSANYQFDLAGTEKTAADNPSYVLAVRPRKDNKFLYRGKIWVDASDFAVTRMEGQPAKSPSFWIKDTEIDSTWQKIGAFWLIQHTQSTSHIRLGGTATLTIDYTDYQITDVGHAPGPGQSPELPDPSSITPQR